MLRRSVSITAIPSGSSSSEKEEIAEREMRAPLFSVGSKAASSLTRITSPVFPQMVRFGFPGFDSFDYQKLIVGEFLNWFNRDDLTPEDLSVYEFEVDGIPRPLTCPYCNEPHDFGSLCSHLVQKHFYESRPAVCPGCDSKQTQMLYHIVAAHPSMLRIKKRNYLQSPPLSPMSMNALSQQIQQASEFKMSDPQQATVIRQETSLQKLLDSSKTHLQSSVPMEDMLRNHISVAVDDFVAASNAEDTLTPSVCEEEKSKEKEESISDASLTPEQREQKQKRAEFVQELVMSSIFDY